MKSKLLFNSMRMMVCRNYSSSYKHLIVEKEGPVALFGLNRPEVRNSVNEDLANDLKKAIDEFENNDEQLVGVLHGIGGNFCAGYDLKLLSSVGSDYVVPKNGTVGPTLRYIKKPMVASVSGYAVAGGFELALMCDLRVVEDSAIMGVYCRRFGVPLIDGGTVRLQASVGLSRALDLILTGRSLDAKEAIQIGVANRVVATGTGLGQAIQLATSLLKFPQLCMLTDRKSTYNAAFSASYEQLLQFESENGSPIVQKESIEGAKRFTAGYGRHGKVVATPHKGVKDWEKEDAKCKL